jgi:hypothetical protein
MESDEELSYNTYLSRKLQKIKTFLQLMIQKKLQNLKKQRRLTIIQKNHKIIMILIIIQSLIMYIKINVG